MATTSADPLTKETIVPTSAGCTIRSACGKGDPELDNSDPLRAEARAAQLGASFRANYRKAEAMAKAMAKAGY